jgi:hypothetical protein
MDHLYFIIENIEHYIDNRYGYNRIKYSGINITNQKVSFVTEEWVKKEVGEKFYYKEILENGNVKTIVDDSRLEHTYFKIGSSYIFEFKGVRIKNEKEYLILQGEDNIEYELPKLTWISNYIKTIGDKYPLTFEKITKGRVILKYSIRFYDLDYIDNIVKIKSLYNDIVSSNDFEKQFQVQHNNRDNKWIISFINHLSEYLYGLLYRKDWNGYKLNSKTFVELEKWVLNSGYLNLYSKEVQVKIKKRISELLSRVNQINEIVELILTYSEEDYILNITNDDLNSDISYKLIYLIKFNPDILENKSVFIKLYNLFINYTLEKDQFISLIFCLELFFNRNNKIYRTGNLTEKSNKELLLKLVTISYFIHDLSVIGGYDFKSKTYLSKIFNYFSEIYPNECIKYLSFRKNIFQNKYTSKVFDDIDLKNIDRIEKIFIDTKDDINIPFNKLLEVEVIGVQYQKNGKVNNIINGYFVYYNNIFGIIPKKGIYEENLFKIKVGSKLNVFVSEYISEVNLLIFSQYSKSNNFNKTNVYDDRIEEFDLNLVNSDQDILVGTITNVNYYGVFVNSSLTNTGLLHFSNIHKSLKHRFKDLLFRGFKMNVSIINMTDNRTEFSNIDILNKFFSTYTDDINCKIQVSEFQNDIINILFDDKYYFPFSLNDIILPTENSILDYKWLKCKLRVDDSLLVIINVYEFELNDLIEDVKDDYSHDLINYLNEIGLYLEDSLEDNSDLVYKIKILDKIRNIYSFLYNNRSFFISIYTTYLKILLDFSKNDNFKFSLYNDTYDSIINDEKLNESFKSVKHIIDHLTLIRCFDDYSINSYHKIIEYLFEDDFENLSTLILKYKIETKNKRNSDLRKKIIPQLSEEVINLISIEKSFIDFDLFTDNQENNSYITELLSLIKKGENRNVEFKSSLYTPLSNEGGKVIKSEVLIHTVMKNIVGLVNTDGGKLFIGISDNGEIIGLDSDFSKFYKEIDKNDKFKLIDKYRLSIDDYLETWVGNDIRKYIQFEILSYQNKEFCVFHLSKKDRKRPYSVHHDIDKNTNSVIKNKKVPYFRGEGGTRQYSTDDLLDLVD